jgi:hypothetical protein
VGAENSSEPLTCEFAVAEAQIALCVLSFLRLMRF